MIITPKSFNMYNFPKYHCVQNNYGNVTIAHTKKLNLEHHLTLCIHDMQISTESIHAECNDPMTH